MSNIFISELPFNGKVKKDWNNLRVEYVWMLERDADHVNINEYNDYSYNEGDEIFIIFPKQIQNFSPNIFDIPKQFKRAYQNRITVNIVQEGPRWLFQDYSIKYQLKFLAALNDADKILVHNKIDAKYYSGIVDTEIEIIPSKMYNGFIKTIKPKPEHKIIIGGNCSAWYNGISSVMLAKKYFEDSQIYIPSMGRRQSDEHLLGINILPYMNWNDWMQSLSTFKYAIHIMPTEAAGTFIMNCAYFGIPCIGNKTVDTQICSIDLAVDVWDNQKADWMLGRLVNDKGFYNICAQTAKSMVTKKYIWRG